MSYDFIPLLIAGITLGLSAGVSPGPLMALTISETLKYGIKAGLLVAFVPVITDLPIVAGSIFILLQFQDITLFLIIISILGAFYLFYLGYENLKLSTIKIDQPSGKNSSFKKGVITNYTNPNPYIFWITIGGPLLISAYNNSPVNSFAFITGFYFFLVGVKVLIVLIGGSFKNFFQTKWYMSVIKFMGILLIVFGLVLLFDSYQMINGI